MAIRRFPHHGVAFQRRAQSAPLLEGVVAKRLASAYEPHARDARWSIPL
ncbi:hypothetical protein [Nonomuraea sp. NEAU-A123]|nr:hypothetical protein [Nonomuraea sp. NEAU-A123]